MLLIVAANNNEDTVWLNKVVNDIRAIATVSVEYHPPGREAHTYLNELSKGLISDDVVLCQGDPFKHDPEFIEHLKDESVRWYGTVETCDHNSRPHYVAPLSSWCDVLGLVTPIEFKFVAGAQYRLTGDQIRSKPKVFYEAMLNMTYVEPRCPWIYERLWPLIWDFDL